MRRENERGPHEKPPDRSRHLLLGKSPLLVTNVAVVCGKDVSETIRLIKGVLFVLLKDDGGGKCFYLMEYVCMYICVDMFTHSARPVLQ